MSLSPAFLDELRSRTLLSALIGRTTKLQKAGREHRACCPFHNEKTPSFYVNDDKGFYHCFGCSAHGDAIRWLTDQRGLPFMDAVKELAQAAGMELPAMDARAAERAEAAKGLHEACGDAAAWFTEQLHGLAGAEARAVLEKRGIRPETARDFGLGFAPDSRGKLKTALKDYGDPMLVEAGLLISVEGKDPYDRFRGRLMIPIRDQRGRAIAFGGRIIGDGEPKYLNSPETPLFDKGRTLYNLDKAAPAARKANRVLVVEGYMDVIALAQAGFGEAVAPLGTALTEPQLERLWRISDVPILCFDGDSAGQKAAIRAAHRALPMLTPGRSLAFVTLPQGQDPDDLVRAKGPAAFEALLRQTQPLVDRLWAHELAAEPTATPEQKAGLKARFTELANSIADSDVKHEYLADFRRRFDEMFRPQRSAFVPFAPRAPGGGGAGGSGRRNGQPWKLPIGPIRAETKAAQSLGVDSTHIKLILAGLIRHPAEIARHIDVLGLLRPAEPSLNQLFDKIIDLAINDHTLDSARLLTILAASGFDQTVGELFRADQPQCSFTEKDADPERARADLDETIAILVARPEVVAALNEATAAMMTHFTAEAFDRQRSLVNECNALESRLANLVQANEDARAFKSEGS
ncbi:DNA primase [Sphingomonas populi]|uniref:DNA primase n=1 Tax=Sphingomonas populi TaxID=2484750 RepID=A0A4Q6Y3N4_9SPHN|nr:DNA primase [Sphingomonas populi]RZF63726.1 DNA primase [Sphingomonas populi]